MGPDARNCRLPAATCLAESVAHPGALRVHEGARTLADSLEVSMHRRAAVLGIALIVASAQGCRRHAAPPLGLERGADAPVTFPAADDGWTERDALPPRTNAKLAVETKLTVTSPALDEKKHFEFEGQTLRLYFNGAAKPANPPKIAVTPAVKGK